VPPPVTDLLSQVAGWDIVLTWTAPAALSVDHYVVYRSTDPQFVPGHTDSIASTTQTAWVDSGAAKVVGTDYFYVVKSVSPGGQKSEVSNRVGEFDRSLQNAPSR